MPTTVVNRKTSYYDVGIMRPTKWGNPYVIGKDGNRKQVIDQYRRLIMTQYHLLADIGELRGKILGCCCKPKDCHGDVLAVLADMPEINLFKMAMLHGIDADETGWFEFYEEWMAKPNKAFDDRTPQEMIASGDSRRLWDMMYRLESGEPG